LANTAGSSDFTKIGPPKRIGFAANAKARLAITPAAMTPVPARNARLDMPAIGNMTNVP
jgi:hypothetical protein